MKNSEVIVVGADTTILSNNEIDDLHEANEDIESEDNNSPDMSHVSVVVVGGDNDDTLIKVMDSSLETNNHSSSSSQVPTYDIFKFFLIGPSMWKKTQICNFFFSFIFWYFFPPEKKTNFNEKIKPN